MGLRRVRPDRRADLAGRQDGHRDRRRRTLQPRVDLRREGHGLGLGRARPDRRPGLAERQDGHRDLGRHLHQPGVDLGREGHHPAGEDSALALTSDGKVIGWGGEYSASHPVVPASLDGKTVTAISAGWHHNLALTSDGKVTVWGYSYELDYADVPASLDSKTVTAVAAGLYQLLALTSDGEVTAWGVSYYGTTTDVPASLNGETFLAVAAGADFSVALTKGRAPVVSASPVSTKVDVGKKTSFTAAATGSPAPAAQWQRAEDGEAFADVPGATSTTFAPTAAAADDGARFRAVFTNTFGSATTAAATLSVNRPPSAKNLGVTAGFGSATPVNLTATDPDGDALTYVIATQPQHGKLSGSAPALTYTPDAGYSGADSFTYRGNDGTLRSATATVSILVTAKPNKAPTAT
ncbi:MAG: hypothetical protein EOP01_09205, partial [Propionibacteriaceae bacterium]